MKFVTFNVRREFEQDGINRFSNRKEKILSIIEKYAPDIIGFQEVLPDALAFLQNGLKDYMVAGCGRDKDLLDEATAIAYKRDKFNLVSMSTFWLSETPTVPGSRYKDQSECPRTCTEVVLYSFDESKIIRVNNTHLDHLGSNARMLGIKQILNRFGSIEMFKESPYVLMGDFNALPDDPEIKYITEQGNLIDVTKDLPGTFHDFGLIQTPEKIDYIYSSTEWQLLSAGLLCSDAKNYVSDHYPIFVEMTTK